jgi:hypothetical protein
VPQLLELSFQGIDCIERIIGRQKVFEPCGLTETGLDEQTIRAYIRDQEAEDQRQESFRLKLASLWVGTLWGPSSNCQLCGQ